MKSKIIFALAVFSVLGAVACAQKKVSKDLDQEVAEQPVRPMHGGVAFKGFEAIQSSKSLTAQQKEKLRELHESMIAGVFGIQEETSKLKGVLFETITTAPYDAGKVKMLKKRLVSLNALKMNQMFHALNEAEKILKQVPPEQKQEIYLGLFFDEPGLPAKSLR